MYEIKILHSNCASVQKTLNQWKHQFKVKIHSVLPCPHTEGNVIATICRTSKKVSHFEIEDERDIEV